MTDTTTKTRQIGGDPASFEILDEFMPNPQKMVADGGSFLKEGIGFIGALMKEDVIGKSEQKPFSSGSLENFQTPKTVDPETLAKAKIRQEKAAYLETYNVIAQAARVVEHHEAKVASETQVRFEIAGMDDEEFAKEAGYKNTSFRGLFGRALRTIANFMQVFTRKVEAMQKSDAQKLTPASIREGRLTAQDYFMQMNMAGERQGGQHVMNAAG